MSQFKEWYKSRTIWTAIVTAAFGILSSMDLLPEWLAKTPVDEIVTLCLSGATIFFRFKADKAIVPIVPTAPPIA